MPNQIQAPAPCAFLSYSWSSPQHEQWVIDLATRLFGDGVVVRLDKWDLKPGHDSYKFMESMVTDPQVTKVLMICDKIYAEKANARSGGVGSESQIISPELYGKGAQDKFAALTTDVDIEGKPHVPVFYKGRIYFDFAARERFEESYDRLLRWLIDRPLHIKPKLGSIPESILQMAPAANATVSRAKRAEEAIRQGIPSASALIREYGDALVAEISTFAPNRRSQQPFDEAVLEAVSISRPYLRQLAELVTVAVRFGQDEEIWNRMLLLHEQIGRLMFRSAEVTHYQETDFDTFKLIAHESFLSTIAIALSEERFDLVKAALKRGWVLNPRNGRGPATSNYTMFNPHIETIYNRQQRLKPQPLSLQGNLLKESHPIGGSPSFESLMQADFVLFLCSTAEEIWYPLTLVHTHNHYYPFEIFARAESKTYFSRINSLLNVSSVAAFKLKIADLQNSNLGRSMYGHRGLAIATLANNEHVGTID